MINEEILAISKKFEETLFPLQIYLFGSYARDDFTPDSDYDFYIIMPDENYDNVKQTDMAYCSLIGLKRKAVDIVLGNKTLFEERSKRKTLEQTVKNEGVLLYAR